jgi:hypothetical protein
VKELSNSPEIPLLEGVSQSCFDFVATHLGVSHWNSTNGFRRLKSAATKNRIMTQSLRKRGTYTPSLFLKKEEKYFVQKLNNLI